MKITTMAKTVGMLILLGNKAVFAMFAQSSEFALDKSCSRQSDSLMLLIPIAPQANPSLNGVTVTEVAQDGFTAVGLSYQTGAVYDTEVDAWLNSDLCMIRRIWPTRTVEDRRSAFYYGPVGSLVRNSEYKEVLCSHLSQSEHTFTYAPADIPIDKYCIIEEIGNASAAQMDAWIEQIEQIIIETVADPLLNSRTIAWYMGPEETDPNEIQEMELFERIYAAVQQHDPLNRPAWTYSQQRADEELLDSIAPFVDAFMVGAYPNHTYNMNQRIQVVHAMKQMNNTNENLANSSDGKLKRLLPALEMYERPYIVDENSNEDLENCIPDQPANALQVSRFVRHDAYAAFANGADGIIIWSMGYRSDFTNYTNYYNAWSQVVQETEWLGLRDVFADGEVIEGHSLDILDENDNINFNWCKKPYPKPVTYSKVSSRRWLFDGQIYLLLVNSSEEPVELVVKDIPVTQYQDILNSIPYFSNDDGLALQLPALGVALLVSEQSTPNILTTM